jgi:hypothetical protein
MTGLNALGIASGNNYAELSAGRDVYQNDAAARA